MSIKINYSRGISFTKHSFSLYWNNFGKALQWRRERFRELNEQHPICTCCSESLISPRPQQLSFPIIPRGLKHLNLARNWESLAYIWDLFFNASCALLDIRSQRFVINANLSQGPWTCETYSSLICVFN